MTESSPPASTRFAVRFAQLAAQGETLLMPFLPIGFPSISATHELVDALIDAGADALELGIPFSDPVADGPVLQAAAAAALEGGAHPRACFEAIAAIRARHPDVPIAVLTYMNLVEGPGRDVFFARAGRAGVDALVLADLPCREAAPYVHSAAQHGVNCALLVAPDTPPATQDLIAQRAGGFTYVVARRGITGARNDGPAVPAATLARLAAAGAPHAVVGFGLSTPAHVAAIAQSDAAGAIVGSAFVDRLAREGPAAAVALIRDCKTATRP